MLVFTLISDAQRKVSQAQQAIAVVVRSMPHNPERDALSAALSDLVIAQASIEALRAKCTSTPRPVVASPTAGN